VSAPTKLERLGGEPFRALLAQTGGHVTYHGGVYWLAGPWREAAQLTARGTDDAGHLATATRILRRVLAGRAESPPPTTRVVDLLDKLRGVTPHGGGVYSVSNAALDTAWAWAPFYTLVCGVRLRTGEEIELRGGSWPARADDLVNAVPAQWGAEAAVKASEGGS